MLVNTWDEFFAALLDGKIARFDEVLSWASIQYNRTYQNYYLRIGFETPDGDNEEESGHKRIRLQEWLEGKFEPGNWKVTED